MKQRRRPKTPAEAPGDEALVHVHGRATCPLCLDELTSQPQLEVCPECETIQHASCVAELGVCGTPGCTGLQRRRSGQAGVDVEERNLAMIAHLVNLFGGSLIGPAVILALSRRTKPFAAHHARQAVAWVVIVPMLLLTLAAMVGGAGQALGADPLHPAVAVMLIGAVVNLALMIRAAVQAHRGEWEAYPLLSRVIRPPDGRGGEDRGAAGGASEDAEPKGQRKS